MASRTLSRRAMRDQHDAAEPDEPERGVEESDESVDEDAPKPRARKKATKTPAKPGAAAKPRARKKATKAPERVIARWAVCDNGAKRVAVFEYKDRVGADAKLAEVRERKTGTFYLTLVKDPYDAPAAPAAPARTG
ncbi:hypothetical protein [Frigoriglobus tundricola]|uniref:Uncharacterized protein n=1 Tax=Frigoriglobus tundricola TaxID=2774151 RepID=A0A6M5Z371_9BACT|nr:hypothetical protein [Frigoriglobus tundricola]QJX00536.1 hypothetical protein FTUN_8166 [Frigoriglobus tundricola]